MSTSLVPLESTRLWGRVKIPFTPEAQATTTLSVVVSVPPALVSAVLKPVFSYLTDITPETIIPQIDTPFPVAIELGATYLEFRVSYPNQSEANYNPTWLNPTSFIGFTVSAQPFDQVFLNFGVREYKIQLRTLRGLDGLKVIYASGAGDQVLRPPAIPPQDLDGIFRAHYAVLHCAQANTAARDFTLKLRDINDRAFTAGLSEGDLPLYPWDATVAPWPVFSSPSNVLGPDYSNGQNFMVYYSTETTSVGVQDFLDSLQPVTGNFTTGFLIPSVAKTITLRRTYMQSTVATALANAQLANPSVQALNDCMIVSVEDAARHNPSFGGRLLRYMPPTRIAVGVTP